MVRLVIWKRICAHYDGDYINVQEIIHYLPVLIDGIMI